MAKIVLRSLAWLVIGPPILLFVVLTSPVWLAIGLIQTFISIAEYATTGDWHWDF